MQPWEVDQALFREYGARYCTAPESMHADCSGAVVRAHTVSKSGSLKRIAADGHVYAFVPSIMSIAKGKGVLAPELRGVNQASTFTGFCAVHDKRLFAPVEDAPFEFTNEQCFLLAYRAQAREGFLKRAQRGTIGLMKKADRGLSGQHQKGVHAFAARMSTGIEAGADDAERHKSTYDAVLNSGDYSQVRSYVLIWDLVPSVMCSGGLFPYECFDGSVAQDLLDMKTPAQALYYNSFAAGDVGGVVFTWLQDSDAACDHFISTLEAIDGLHLTDALVRFFFEYCENVQLSPAWWESLDRESSRALVRRLNAAANPLKIRRRDCLGHDGLRYDDWGIRARYRVGQTNGSA